MHRKLFFDTSEAIADRLTETFDFVWSTATAQWNLRWQVDGYLRASPDATDDELKSRFALGSGIRGANLRRYCVQTTWPEQQEMFARVLLIEFCALYEAWIDGVLEELGHRSTHASNLQFPTTNNGGLAVALTALLANISPELQQCIYPVLKTNRKNSLPKLESLLICYRYFKEARNAVIHHGGVASQRALNAYLAFSGETAASLGVTEVPRHFPIGTIGDLVKLSLRGVVGFGEIVLKLVTTLDAELSQTTEAEAVFDSRWRAVIGPMRYLPASASEKEAKLVQLVRKLGLETPTQPVALLPMLHRRRLVAPI